MLTSWHLGKCYFPLDEFNVSLEQEDKRLKLMEQMDAEHETGQ